MFIMWVFSELSACGKNMILRAIKLISIVAKAQEPLQLTHCLVHEQRSSGHSPKSETAPDQGREHAWAIFAPVCISFQAAVVPITRATLRWCIVRYGCSELPSPDVRFSQGICTKYASYNRAGYLNEYMRNIYIWHYLTRDYVCQLA